MSDDERKSHPRQQELQDLMDDNRSIFQDIQRKGARIGREQVQQGLLQFFVQWIMDYLGEGDEDKVQDLAIDFEIKWQKEINERLHDTRREVNRQKLLAGGHKPKGSGLYVPGPGNEDSGSRK